MLGVFLDIETTGLDPMKHVPIDLAFVVIELNEGKEIARYQSLISHSQDAWENFDPESLIVNGLTFDAASSGKPPDQIKKEVIETLQKAGVVRGKAVFICQNPGFDRGFFNQIVDVYTQESLHLPYHWLDLASMFWKTLQSPYPGEMQLTKNAIAYFYGLEKEEEPHSAINGVLHLIECYKKVLGVSLLIKE